jgi:hypothetical protein
MVMMMSSVVRVLLMRSTKAHPNATEGIVSASTIPASTIVGTAAPIILVPAAILVPTTILVPTPIILIPISIILVPALLYRIVASVPKALGIPVVVSVVVPIAKAVIVIGSNSRRLRRLRR